MVLSKLLSSKMCREAHILCSNCLKTPQNSIFEVGKPRHRIVKNIIEILPSTAEFMVGPTCKLL